MDKIEFKDKLVSVNRITKVVKGGRRFTFSALVVAGNYAGSVGVGYAKAKQVPDAIKKATQDATRNQIKVSLKDGRTLHHDVKGRNGSGKVLLRAAPAGTGIIAGGPTRGTRTGPSCGGGFSATWVARGGSTQSPGAGQASGSHQGP